MEKLILEITHRGKSSYHKLSTFPVTIGRAYDCDVIVSDITVSPRHLTIDETGDGFELSSFGNQREINPNARGGINVANNNLSDCYPIEFKAFCRTDFGLIVDGSENLSDYLLPTDKGQLLACLF